MVKRLHNVEESRGFLPHNGDAEYSPRLSSVDADQTSCGIGPVGFCQGLGRIETFVGVVGVCSMTTQLLSHYLASQITTIEKQFGLSSAQSGFLLSCNDIGFLVTALFASYAASKVHIPRSLALMVIIYGGAALICAAGYFLSKDMFLDHKKLFTSSSSETRNVFLNQNSTFDLPTPEDRVFNLSTYHHHQVRLCQTGADNTDTMECTGGEKPGSLGIGVPNKYTTVGLTLLAIGMFLQGMAKSSRVPFVTLYVDNNVEKTETAMYMGVIGGFAIFGPPAAFAIGGLFSRQYVTLEAVPITPRHPAWIGAWWLGFVLVGLMSILAALPLCCFPRRLKGSPSRPLRITPTRKIPLKATVKGFWQCLYRLVSNPVYMLLLAGVAAKAFGTGGALSFVIKYVETQFYLPTWKANLMLGGLNVVNTCTGTIVGGCIVTKKKLSPLGCIKLLLVALVVIAAVCGVGFFLGCDHVKIVGVTSNGEAGESSDNSAVCSRGCGCESDVYFPVCGNDGISYMSPCHAGCSVQGDGAYEDCSCIHGNGTAVAGLCDMDCPRFYLFIVYIAVWAFCESISAMPLLISLIRSVKDEDKTMAVGLLTLSKTLFGWFLAPIFYGYVIDTTCQIWNTSCTVQGACAFYNTKDFRVRFIGLFLASKVLSLLLMICTYFKARHKTDWSTCK